MKSLHSLVIMIAAAVALAFSVSAQQQPATSSQEDQGMQGMQSGQTQHGNMNQLMQNCQKTMQPMMQANTQAKKDIETAKASNDPAKMRSALEEAEKAIDGMNTHMGSCMRMMNMMQNMQGVGGMMGGQQSTPQNPPKQ